MRTLGLASILAMAVAGCPAAPTPACAPGRVLDCPGPGGCAGAQTCLDDGNGYGACTCVGGLDASVVDAPSERDAGDVLFDVPISPPDDIGLPDTPDSGEDAGLPLDGGMDAAVPVDTGTDATLDGGPDVPFDAACRPRTCGSYFGRCGVLPNDCGGTIACNTCLFPQVCGTDNRCCTRLTCTSYPGMCGTLPDGCGGSIRCTFPGCDAG